MSAPSLLIVKHFWARTSQRQAPQAGIRLRLLATPRAASDSLRALAITGIDEEI
jgi:hypothetical protein